MSLKDQTRVIGTHHLRDIEMQLSATQAVLESVDLNEFAKKEAVGNYPPRLSIVMPKDQRNRTVIRNVVSWSRLLPLLCPMRGL